MNRRRLRQLGGGLGPAGLLAACGGDDDGEATSAAAPVSSSAPGKSNPLGFTCLEPDQQALAEVAAGVETDVTHPCLASTRNWADAGRPPRAQAAFAPGVTWPEVYLENRADDVKAAKEVKAA